MFGGIAVDKEIYAGITTQICVCLCVGEFETLRERSDTCYHIFYFIKYLFLVHDF